MDFKCFVVYILLLGGKTEVSDFHFIMCVYWIMWLWNKNPIILDHVTILCIAVYRMNNTDYTQNTAEKGEWKRVKQKWMSLEQR